MSKLVTPLFVNGNFNRNRKKIRAEFVAEVSDGQNSFELYRHAGKIENNHSKNDKDTHYLYVLLNGWLVPLRMTEYQLIWRVGQPNAEKELYGNAAKRGKWIDSFKTLKEKNKALAEEARLVELYGSDSSSQYNYIQQHFKSHIDNFERAKRDPVSCRPDFIGASYLNQIDICLSLSEAHKSQPKAKD